MSGRNKELVRRCIEQAVNTGSLKVADELLANDYVYREPTVGEKRGREGFKQLITMYRTAFPDVRLTVEQQIAEGDLVVTRWTARGHTPRRAVRRRTHQQTGDRAGHPDQPHRQWQDRRGSRVLRRSGNAAANRQHTGGRAAA